MGRYAALGLGGLLLIFGTACPVEWRKDGFNDRAARKDARARLQVECPVGKTSKWVCDDPEEEDSCMWTCE